MNLRPRPSRTSPAWSAGSAASWAQASSWAAARVTGWPGPPWSAWTLIPQPGTASKRNGSWLARPRSPWPRPSGPSGCWPGTSRWLTSRTRPGWTRPAMSCAGCCAGLAWRRRKPRWPPTTLLSRPATPKRPWRLTHWMSWPTAGTCRPAPRRASPPRPCWPTPPYASGWPPSWAPIRRRPPRSCTWPSCGISLVSRRIGARRRFVRIGAPGFSRAGTLRPRPCAKPGAAPSPRTRAWS